MRTTETIEEKESNELTSWDEVEGGHNEEASRLLTESLAKLTRGQRAGSWFWFQFQSCCWGG